MRGQPRRCGQQQPASTAAAQCSAPRRVSRAAHALALPAGALRTWSQQRLVPLGFRSIYYYRDAATQFRVDVMVPVVVRGAPQPLPGARDPAVRQIGPGDALHL